MSCYEERISYCSIRPPIDHTISLVRFQAFADISLSGKLIGKSNRSQNKTFIRGASIGISLKNGKDKQDKMFLLNKLKVCYNEIDIFTLFIKDVCNSVQIDGSKSRKGKDALLFLVPFNFAQ